MGRVVFGLLLGFAVVFGVAFWARTCLPDPNDKGVEWLHREDVIIVQVDTSGGDHMIVGLRSELMPPRFTLYGDGTVFLASNTVACPGTSDLCPTVLEGKLSSGQVRDLLTFIAKQGFFDFSFNQPQPPVSGAPTTYIFAGTLREQNAVRAGSLGWPATSGKEWEQFRKLQEINTRIAEVGEGALKEALEYQPEAVSLLVRESQAAEISGTEAWPAPSIDLAALASNDRPMEHVLAGAAARELMDAKDAAWPQAFVRTFTQDRRSFAVAYRLVLPYEENFPEFEPPE